MPARFTARPFYRPPTAELRHLPDCPRQLSGRNVLAGSRFNMGPEPRRESQSTRPRDDGESHTAASGEARLLRGDVRSRCAAHRTGAAAGAFQHAVGRGHRDSRGVARRSARHRQRWHHRPRWRHLRDEASGVQPAGRGAVSLRNGPARIFAADRHARTASTFTMGCSSTSTRSRRPSSNIAITPTRRSNSCASSRPPIDLPRCPMGSAPHQMARASSWPTTTRRTSRRYRAADPVQRWRSRRGVDAPGSPRVTCPEFVTIEGKTRLLFTTAIEGMPPETRAIAPHAGKCSWPDRLRHGRPKQIALPFVPTDRLQLAERLASEESEYPASVVGRRNGCIRD